MRATLLAVLACMPLLVPSGPAKAFSRIGCFVAPTAHRSAAAIISAIDGDLGMHRPGETRACLYYGRGLLYHLQGNYARAVANYTSAIGWMQTYGDAYAARADAYDDMGQHENALRDYALAAQYSSDSPDGLTERCWLRALRGHPLALALQDCNASLREQPGDFDALSSRALVYVRLAKYAEAIANCDAALREKPNKPSTLFIRGLAKLRAGDTQGGNADLAAAIADGDRVKETFAIYGVKP